MTDMDRTESVRRTLLAAGHADSIAEFPAGTRTAEDAAAAVGCTVAQIAKSIIFRSGDDAILVIASGAHRIDRGKIAAIVGRPVKSADPAWVEERTGYAVGGVPPVGHDAVAMTILDESLAALDPIWAAAGSPTHAFRTTAADLVAIGGAQVADVRQG